MYLDYFGLREAPFAITPDPRFVFLSERHREALAHLRYGIARGGSGGFVLLTGDIGTGKTTLSRLLLEQLPEGTQAGLLLNPKVNANELLQGLCDELGVVVAVSARDSGKALIDALNAHLLAAHARGGQVVALIDEAQNLSTEALEQVRLLTNLETPTAKLLQVILLGQPELRDVLAREELTQLAQRITARYHLTPLDPVETESYIRHRLAVAGSKRSPFTASALRALHARAGGVPRRINIIADRALTGAYAQQLQEVGAPLVHRAADEALGEVSGGRRPWFAVALGSLLAVAALGLAITATQQPRRNAALPSAETAGPTGSTQRKATDGAERPIAETPPARDTSAAGTDPASFFPSGLPVTLGPGASGAGVEWLERALAAAGVQIPPAHVAGRYDAALAVAVRDAQRRFGLREDGIAGRETQWVLAGRAAAATQLPGPAGQELAPPPRPLNSPPSPPR